MIAGDDLLQVWQQKAPAENGAQESSPETSVSCLATFYPGEEENPGGLVGGQSPFWNWSGFCSDTGRLTAGPLLHSQGQPEPGESPEPQPRDLWSSLTSDSLLQHTERKSRALGAQDPTRQQGPCPCRMMAWGSACNDWTLSRSQGPHGVLMTTCTPECGCTTRSKARPRERWSPLQGCAAERQETGLSSPQGGGSHGHA